MSLILARQGDNKTLKDFRTIVNYITDPLKTKSKEFSFAFGCITDDPLAEMIALKKIHGKTDGRQYTQTIIAPTPMYNDVSDEEYMEMAKEIGKYYYDLGFQCVMSVHFDTGKRHMHLVLNSVSFQNAKKFSQSISQLNRFKMYCSHIFTKHGFDTIKMPTEKMLDDKLYSFSDGFDFLEAYDEIAEDIAFNFFDITENVGSDYSLEPPEATHFNPDAPTNTYNRFLAESDPVMRDYYNLRNSGDTPIIDVRNAWGSPSELRPMTPPTSADFKPTIIIKKCPDNSDAVVNYFEGMDKSALHIDARKMYDIYVPDTISPTEVDGIIKKIPHTSEKEFNNMIRSITAAKHALEHTGDDSPVSADLTERIRIRFTNDDTIISEITTTSNSEGIISSGSTPIALPATNEYDYPTSTLQTSDTEVTKNSIRSDTPNSEITSDASTHENGFSFGALASYGNYSSSSSNLENQYLYPGLYNPYPYYR